MPNLPVGGSTIDLELGSRQALPERIGRISLGLQYGSYATFAGPDAAAGEPDESLSSRVAMLSARYFFGDGWLANLALPIGAIEHTLPDDEPTQRVAGFGDLELGLGYDLSALWGSGGYRPSLVAELGLRLPTGEEAKTGLGLVPPTLLALGWGAFGLAPRLTLTWFVHPSLAFALPLGLVQPLSSSPAGLRYGTGLHYGLTAVWLPGGGLTISGGLDGNRRSSAHSDLEGEIINSGGHWMYANVGASYRLTDRTTLLLRARLPFLADVNGTQLTETFSVVGTVAWRIGDTAAEHAEHAHEGEVGGRGNNVIGTNDVRHVARGGASFDVDKVLAPGKLTVIDYWAEWCKPCKVIGRMLDELAATHAGLAVRKAEVPGLNTEIARQRLPGVQALPVVHIYGPDGKLLKTLNGPEPGAVRATVLALLAR